MRKQQVPDSLRQAVDYINNYEKSKNTNRKLIVIEHCMVCGMAFPRTTSDSGIHLPRCRVHAEENNREKAAARRKASRERLKLQSLNQQPSNP